MIGILGHFEYKPWAYSPQAVKNLIRFWAYPLKAMGGDTLIMINVDGIDISYGDATINYEVYSELSEAIDAHPEATFIFAEIGEGESLENFEHPEGDVIYVIGSDYGKLNPDLIRELVDDPIFVHIETPGPSILWAHTVGALLLYDRMIKS